MSLIADIMKALDKIDDWRKVRQLPARTDELETRIATLEKLLDGKRPGEVCKGCGAQALRRIRVIGPVENNMMREEWKCQECGQHDRRLVAPSKT